MAPAHAPAASGPLATGRSRCRTGASDRDRPVATGAGTLRGVPPEADPRMATGLILLGGALRKRRQELGLTLREVADRSGLSVGSLSDVERGRTEPSLSSLVAWA